MPPSFNVSGMLPKSHCLYGPMRKQILVSHHVLAPLVMTMP